MAAATEFERKEKFAVMRWLNDKNKVSVLSTKYICEPKKLIFSPGDTEVSRFPGTKKLWQFRILAVGGKRVDLFC